MASQPLRITSIGGFILDDSVISGHKDVKVGLVAATLSIATGSGLCFGCCTVTNWRCLPQDWFSLHVSFSHVWCCSFPIKQSVSELVQLESYRTLPNIFGPKVWKPTGSVKCSPCVNEFILTAPRHHHGLWLLLLRVTTYNLTYVDFTIFYLGWVCSLFLLVTIIIAFVILYHLRYHCHYSYHSMFWLLLSIALTCFYYCLAVHPESIQPNTPGSQKRRAHLQGPCIFDKFKYCIFFCRSTISRSTRQNKHIDIEITTMSFLFSIDRHFWVRQTHWKCHCWLAIIGGHTDNPYLSEQDTY